MERSKKEDFHESLYVGSISNTLYQLKIGGSGMSGIFILGFIIIMIVLGCMVMDAL